MGGELVTHLVVNEGEWPTTLGFFEGLPDHPYFKDGVDVALRIVDTSKSLKEAQERLTKVLYAYEELITEARYRSIMGRLGIWESQR